MNMDDLVVAIPKSIENMQLPSPDLVAYYRKPAMFAPATRL